MLAITSIEPLREVVGSKDQALFDELLRIEEKELREEFAAFGKKVNAHLAEFQEEIERRKSGLRRLLMTVPSDAKEPGSWILLIERIIKIKRWAVKVTDSFDQGYKHYEAWKPYRQLVGARLSAAAQSALEHFEVGRPLRGERVDHDGCLFSWLRHLEIVALHNSLSQISATDVGDPMFLEFHRDLVDALSSHKKKKCDLILGSQ